MRENIEENITNGSRICEPQIRFQQYFFIISCTHLFGSTIVPDHEGGKNFPTSLEISISVLCKCGKRIPVSPSFSVMPSLLEPTLLSLLAGRLERLKMFYLCVVVLGYASIHIYE